MVDRPIIFSGAMVKALIAGTKIQTRRLLSRFRTVAGSPEQRAETWRGAEVERALLDARDFRCVDGEIWSWTAKAFPWQAPAERTNWLARLPYAVGDRLWCREAWAKVGDNDDDIHACPDLRVHAYYRADSVQPEALRWRPSIHMFRWASRITLIVSDIRVQRLQDISKEDVIAEGVDNLHGMPLSDCYAGWHEPYAALWDNLHGRGAWDTNPFVCALTFSIVMGNIDEVGHA